MEAAGKRRSMQPYATDRKHTKHETQRRITILENMQNYFFWCHAKFNAMDIVQSGNHGRVIAQYKQVTKNATDGWKLAIELALENYRLRHFPLKPSRLESVFVFLNKTDALSRRYFGDDALLYEVAFVDPSAPCHVADFDLYSDACRTTPNEAFIPRIMRHAKQYWSGEGNGVKELLTLSNLQIVRKVG
jgi:hypothetical protein